MLLAFETLLNSCQLIIIAHPLVFQPLHDQLICLFNWHCLVVFNHCLVQTVFEHPDGPHLWVVIRVNIKLLLVQFSLFILKSEEVFLLVDGLLLHVILLSHPHSQVFFCFMREVRSWCGGRAACWTQSLWNFELLKFSYARLEHLPEIFVLLL